MSQGLRDASRTIWVSRDKTATIDEINVGSLQRIADAVEKMAVEIVGLMRDRDSWQRRACSAEADLKRLNRIVRRLRKQLAAKETADA